MNKILFASLLLFCTFKAEAQVKNIIKGNPIIFAGGILNAEYEHKLDNKKTLSVGGLIYPFNGNSLFGAFSTLRFYITHKKKEVPAGFYVGPDAGVFLADEDVYPVIGGLIGYQWVWDSGFTLDLGIGPQYVLNGDFEAPIPYPHLTVGYAW